MDTSGTDQGGRSSEEKAFTIPVSETRGADNRNSSTLAEETMNGAPLKVSSAPEALSLCEEIWEAVWDKPNAEQFKYPVDWKALELPDYPEIIKKPMDLDSVRKKLSNNIYSNTTQFAEDLRLIWSNAKCYNRTESKIWENAETLGKFCEYKFNKSIS